METVVIVLLVLLGVIVLTKGKPLWSFLKQFWTFVSKWVAENSVSMMRIVTVVLAVVLIVTIQLFPERTNLIIISGFGMAIGLIIYLVLDYGKHGWT